MLDKIKQRPVSRCMKYCVENILNTMGNLYIRATHTNCMNTF